MSTFLLPRISLICLYVIISKSSFFFVNPSDITCNGIGHALSGNNVIISHPSGLLLLLLCGAPSLIHEGMEVAGNRQADRGELTGAKLRHWNCLCY